MLNLLPQIVPESQPAAYAEAVSRLASVRHALRLVDGGLGNGPQSDDDAIASAWEGAGAARQRHFERRSARLVGSTVHGLEALRDEQANGRTPNPAASDALVDQIRRELQEVAGIILG